MSGELAPVYAAEKAAHAARLAAHAAGAKATYDALAGAYGDWAATAVTA